MNTTEEMKKAILELIKAKGRGVTFDELEEIPGFKGELELYDSALDLVFWRGISDSAIAALNSLRSEKVIAFATTNPLTYHYDEHRFPYPKATDFKRYASTRWIPVTVNLVSDASGKTPRRKKTSS